ncbi:MAG: hypothetical protein ACRDJE_01965, partial [Dehalococcoidia bacterium]
APLHRAAGEGSGEGASAVTSTTRYTDCGMLHLTQRLPGSALLPAAVDRWQRFSRSPLGVRLIPLYVALAGAAVGVLVADQLIRSMWEHSIFTGRNQWRTVAFMLTLFWIAIGAVAATALLGPPASESGGSGGGAPVRRGLGNPDGSPSSSNAGTPIETGAGSGDP